jgi:polygalacturonase
MKSPLIALVGSFSIWLLMALPAFAAEQVFDIRDFAAKPDGKTLCTTAIQQAIDHAASLGGGAVRIPAGTWLSGTIYLESHITLQLDQGATLLGSPRLDDYKHQRKPLAKTGRAEPYQIMALIAGKDLEDVAIRGQGTIDGNGSAYRYKEHGRPRGISLVDCRDVLIEGVRMQSAGSWMQHYRGCQRLAIRGIRVFNHATYNNDGLDIDSCRDVVVSDCRVDSDDDAIVLKSVSARPCQNVAITNCVASSHCNSIKLGTESGGGFTNIAISNCAVQSPQETRHLYGQDRGLAGLALEIVDGGTLDRVAISNVTIQGVSVPIFLRLGNRARQYEGMKEKPGVGTLRNVVLSNIVATGVSPIGCSITGLPEHPIENVTLSRIKLSFDGGGTLQDASRKIPERPEAYPESTMFGTLPAYGFYCRHVKGLVFDDLVLNTAAADLRYAMVLDDVEGVALEGLDAAWTSGAAAQVLLSNVREALIRGCRPAAEVFLKITGRNSRRIMLMENDLGRVKTVAELAAEVPKGTLWQPRP